MNLLLPLALYALVVHYGASSPPSLATKPSPLLSRACDATDVLAVSGFALEDINRDRKDGYVLSLNRVSDAREHRQAHLGSLYYLTLDVLETKCHVLSNRSWKDCEARVLHESVYGQCKALFYINKPRRILYTPAYNCTLHPVSRRSIHRMCPDCPSPSPTDLSDPSVLEAVAESLAKYNDESNLKQYSLVKVTRASSQWVFGPAYFVEYLIRESPCTKSQASSCTLQSPNSEPVGLCKGSLSRNNMEKHVSVTCDFFKSQVQDPETKNSAVNQGPANFPQQKSPAPQHSPSPPVLQGSVQHLPDLDDEKPTVSQEKGLADDFPVHLNLTTNPQGDSLDVSFLFMEPVKEKIVVFPFPSKEQRSAKCPGPAEKYSPFILPP